MLAPIVTLVNSFFTQIQPLALPIVGIAVFIAGLYWAMGNHNHGKERAIAAMIGGVLMLSAQTIAAALHA